MIALLLDQIYGWVWGIPLLLLLMGVGLYLTFQLRGLQFTHLSYALRLAFGAAPGHEGKGDISHFASLMTALATTIGIGHIAGVATAVAIGGLGALFWMWVTAFIGMAIKYSEAVLAIRFRTLDERGEMSGGPMYYIERGLGWRRLAIAYALFVVIGTFCGGNMLQANSVADVMQSFFSIDRRWTGAILTLLIGWILFGGIRSISRVASFIVPVMMIFYIGGAALILIKFWDRLPEAFFKIVTHAFTGQAAFGGFAGSTLLMGLQVGLSRGLMTSEAGLGTGSIAAAAARTDLPGRQALVSMTGCFLATIIMCSATGLVLVVTDTFGTLGPDGRLLTGAAMTLQAFASSFPGGGYVVTISLILFAFSTIIGFAYYGEKCAKYLLGARSVPLYRLLFTLMLFPGAVLGLEVVWKVADICNALMAFPNLIALYALSGIVVHETRTLLKVLQAEKPLKAREPEGSSP